jgi:outer membrane protein TolC
MPSHLLKYFYALILILVSNNSFAQKLDLDTFVRHILANNPGVQKILAENNIAEGTLEASLGVDDGVIGSSLKFAHTEPNQIIGSELDRSNDALLTLSYDRTFSEYGTRVSLGYNNQHTSRSPSLSGSLGSSYYQPSFTLGLVQPLLKNAGGIQDKLNIKVNSLNLKLAKLNSKENLESYITQLAGLYLDWYLASRELAISKEVYEQVLAQENLTRTKVERQVIEEHELLRVQETKEDYYSRLQQAMGRYEGLTHQIKYQMNLSVEHNENIEPKNPKTTSLLQPKLRKEGYLTSISRLKIILDNLAQQQVLLLDAKGNSKKSDLNLNLAYTHHGEDTSYQDTDKNDVSLMVEYKKPLGNRTATGNYAVQLAKKDQIESDTKQRLINAEASLANLQSQIKSIFIAIKATERKINIATKKLKHEQRLFEIGNLDLFELLKDEATQLESRLAKEKLYNQLFTLRLNIGELLDLNLKEMD